MTNKPGQGIGHKSPKPKIRLPKWWAKLKLEARWKDLLAQLHRETPEQLRKRIMTQVSIIERQRQDYNDMEARRGAEKQALQAKIAELEARIRQGRQYSIFGMLNGITNCLEANSRAVHALAEPMQEVLCQLAKDLRLESAQQTVGGGRGWEKSYTRSGIPTQWPQPPKED